MDSKLLEQLITELVDTDHMLVVVDSGGAVAEMNAGRMTETEFGDRWASLESQGWHLHLDMKAVDGVQFVEAEDHGQDILKLYYVRLSDPDGATLIRFYFPNPWLDEDEKTTEFQASKLKFFEDCRDRYVGKGGVEFVRRTQDGGVPP